MIIHPTCHREYRKAIDQSDDSVQMTNEVICGHLLPTHLCDHVGYPRPTHPSISYWTEQTNRFQGTRPQYNLKYKRMSRGKVNNAHSIIPHEVSMCLGCFREHHQCWGSPGHDMLLGRENSC